MNITNEVGGALVNSFEVLFRNVLIFIPKIILAFVIFAVLMWVAKIVAKLIGDLLRLIKVDALFARLGFTEVLHDAGLQISIAYAVQTFVRWTLVLLAGLSAISILGLTQVTNFLEYSLFAILPNIITLALMLFFTIFAANKLRSFVSHSSFVAKHHSPFLANIAWFAVILFGTIATLEQLDILRFITDSVAGIVQALGLGIALALGLAFGLGCKEEARCLIRSWMGKECYDLDCGCNTFGCGKCATNDFAHTDDDCDCDTCAIDNFEDKEDKN
jgi:hypothetical protein